MVRFQQCWSFEECRVPLHCHHPPGPLWPGVVALGRVLSMSELELNWVLMLNWLLWIELFCHLTLCKQKTILLSKVKLATVFEGSLFNSYYTEVYGRVLLLSLDCATLPLIRTLYCWVLSKEVSSTIFNVFGMILPGIETQVYSDHWRTLYSLGQWAG